jgi:hypothetical protein
MGEVVELETYPAAVQRSVIDTLETALAEAREGKVAAVALALVRPSGAINTSRSECDDVGRLLGAMALSQARMCSSIDSDKT